MLYRAVFFDAGGTLFQPHPSVGAIYARVAAGYGMNVKAPEIEEIFRTEFSKRDNAASLKAHSNEKNEREWWHSLVRDIFSHVTRVQNFEPFFEELYDLFGSAQVWRVYPEVVHVLEKLKESNFILGIVSNWDSRLLSICRETKLESYFHFILASAVVGSAKPGRVIFEKALSMARVKPKEALHVGDSVENDVTGAEHAGIDALLINRDGSQIGRIRTIASLEEVLSHVECVSHD